VSSSLAPEHDIFVHGEMRRALESFVVDGEIPIFSLFTPVQTSRRSLVDTLQAIGQS
jgi:hypothetical protein